MVPWRLARSSKWLSDRGGSLPRANRTMQVRRMPGCDAMMKKEQREAWDSKLQAAWPERWAETERAHRAALRKEFIRHYNANILKKKNPDAACVNCAEYFIETNSGFGCCGVQTDLISPVMTKPDGLCYRWRRQPVRAGRG